MCQVHTLGAGAFVAKDFSSTKFELGKHYSGLDVDPKIDYSIDIEHPLIEFFNKNPKAYTLEELRKKFPRIDELECITSLQPSLIAPVQEKNNRLSWCADVFPNASVSGIRPDIQQRFHAFPDTVLHWRTAYK